MSELDHHEWERRAATRMLAAIVVLTLLAAAFLICGCADMSRRDSKPDNAAAAAAEPYGAENVETVHHLWWQLQWEKIAAAAEASGPAQQAAILDALEFAARIRDGHAGRMRAIAATPTTDRESGARNWNAPAADAGGDTTAPTLTRSASALGELATKTER